MVSMVNRFGLPVGAQKVLAAVIQDACVHDIPPGTSFRSSSDNAFFKVTLAGIGRTRRRPGALQVSRDCCKRRLTENDGNR